MVDRGDFRRIEQSTQAVSDAAQRALVDLFNSLDMSDPAWVRDELLEVLPRLVEVYGDAAATAAAEWYEGLRAAEVGGAYQAVLADTVPEGQVRSTVRYAAANLFEGSPLVTLSLVTGALDRYVKYAGRQTVARNSILDPECEGYARVPRGVNTCAFCEVLASRGFVYTSAAEAQRRGRGQHEDKYHDHCHCQVVSVFDRHQVHIDGYDPDAMFERYQKAREIIGMAGGDPSDIKSLTFTLRRLYPGLYTDGVVPLGE